MNKSQKGNTMVAIIVMVVIIVVAAVYYLNRSGSMLSPQTQNSGYQIQPTSQSIQNDKDLTAASADLDNTDLNSMDNELKQNDTDAASF